MVAVARHGQTYSNLSGQWIGKGDDPLNETGMEQSRRLSDLLKGYSFNFVISSDAKRAIQTAEIIAERLGIHFNGGTEVLRGRYTGRLSAEEIEEKLGVKMTSTLSIGLDRFDGTEKISEVLFRVRSFVGFLQKEFTGRRIILITHESLVRAFYTLYVKNPEEILFGNCSHFVMKLGLGKTDLVRDITSIS